MDNFLEMIFRGLVQARPLGRVVWHDDRPKYIRKREQGVVLPHEADRYRTVSREKKVTLLHRKIAPLGKRSKKIWETWYLVI